MWQTLWQKFCQPNSNKAKGTSGIGANQLLFVGVMGIGMSTAPFAVDLPTFFVAQNQLQTTMDAAALAGASQLPFGQAAAESMARQYVAANPVMGQTIDPTTLRFREINNQFSVSNTLRVQTVTSQFLCQFQRGFKIPDPNNPPPQQVGDDCSYMQVAATSTAVPAARDTMIVMDISTSMTDLGNGRPLRDVKQAAIHYINNIRDYNSESVDRIGFVTFGADASLVSPLKSMHDDPGFTQLISRVNSTGIYNAQGWNTNYQDALVKANNELEANARPNAEKIILFMTDGLPNLPAPPSYYLVSRYQPYVKCFNIVNQNPALSQLCYTSGGKRICPKFTDVRVTAPYISAAGQQCGLDYTNYMASSTQAQVNRAESKGVTIHTISIADPNEAYSDNAWSILKRLRKEPNWNPDLLNYMATNTGGEQYWSANYNAQGIQDIYDTISKEVRMRLAERPTQ